MSYTEIIVAADLRKSTPAHVVAAIETMADRRRSESRMPLPDHPLFKTPRWPHLLCGASSFFPALPGASIKPNGETGGWRLSARANHKFAHDEPALFFDFLAPYVDGDSSGERVYVGQYQTDEEVDPTLVYLMEGRVRALKIAPEWFSPPPLKGKPMKQQPPRKQICSVVQFHDQQDAAVRRAMSDAVLEILREIVKERPNALIKDLQRHQLDRLADAAAGKFIEARAAQAELESLLGVDQPSGVDMFA